MAQKINQRNQQIMNTLDNSVQQGYHSAQIYYGQLKQKFITQMQNSLSISAQNIIAEGQTTIEDLIIQGGNQVLNTKEARDKKLNTILTEFAEQLLIDSSVTTALSNAKNQIEELADQSEKKKKKKQAEIIANVQKEIVNKVTPTILKTKFITAIGLYTAGNNIAERYEALVDRVYQFLYYFIKSTLLGTTSYSIYGIPQITLGGLIAEDLEYQNLLTLFSQSAISPGGAKKVTNSSGKTIETELDNIISKLQFVEDNFQKQYSAVEEIIGNNYMNSLQLLKTIEYFGEQVKTFNLSKGRAQRGHLIGSREALASQAKSQGVYSIYQNIKFMSKYKNILQALGPANVLMSTGAGRQWTNDFIQDFREQGYYLMLQYTKTRPPKLSNNVVLDFPVSQSSKNKYKTYRQVKLY